MLCLINKYIKPMTMVILQTSPKVPGIAPIIISGKENSLRLVKAPPLIEVNGVAPATTVPLANHGNVVLYWLPKQTLAKSIPTAAGLKILLPKPPNTNLPKTIPAKAPMITA